MRTIIFLAVCLFACIFAPASFAHGGVDHHSDHARGKETIAQGVRYPSLGNKVYYWRPANMRSWDFALRYQAKAYREIGVYLLPTAKKSRANIIVIQGSGPCGKSGCAEIGWQYTRATKVWLNNSTPQKWRPWLARHEFGHGLGLAHYEKGCSLMNPSWNACLGSKLLGPVEKAALKKMYAKNTYEELPAATNIQMRMPEAFEIDDDPMVNRVLSWEMPSRIYVQNVLITKSVDTCSNDTEAATSIEVDDAMEPVSYQQLPGSGRYCYTIWLENLDGKVGTPAYFWYDYDASVQTDASEEQTIDDGFDWVDEQ